MRLKGQILSVLNAEHDFFLWLASKTKDPSPKLETAFSQIISVITHVINIQCITNKRTEEVCKIAKQCTLLNFNSQQSLSGSALGVKGKGANAELFGSKFAGIVEIIAKASDVKKNSVKEMFLILTPLVLSNIYFNYKANNFTFNQLKAFLEKATRQAKIYNELNFEILDLIIDDTIRQPLQQSKSNHSIFFRTNRLLSYWWRFIGQKIAGAN